MELPIQRFKQDLLDAVAEFQILIVVGDTGSGKTTQLPQYLLLESTATIAVTQPRRIAASSAARRVAEEIKSPIGKLVGYAVRFEKKTSPETRLTYMTDGLLLREATIDPLLSRYSIIILDEAHERSLETDILFGLLKTALNQRSDLKLIVMSATLDIDKFADFFGDCPVFSIPGRMFEIDILWAKKMSLSAAKSTYVERTVQTILLIHEREGSGDV
jgi:HrpA-like RNA helicase